MNFRIRGLEARQFDHLFTLSDAELAEHGAVRRIGQRAVPLNFHSPNSWRVIQRDRFSE